LIFLPVGDVICLSLPETIPVVSVKPCPKGFPARITECVSITYPRAKSSVHGIRDVLPERDAFLTWYFFMHETMGFRDLSGLGPNACGYGGNTENMILARTSFL
jgi:hypothetical protein